MQRIVIGTRNRKKLKEIEAILRGLPVELASLDAWPDAPEVVEDGATFEANAIKKAAETADATGEWVMADDSGLEVEALGGEPGVYSARFAGPEQDDHANIRKLLAELDGVPAEERGAAFRCVIALAKPGEVLFTTEGRLEGAIAFEPRGHNGFGYDPVFEVKNLGKTTAELSPEEKNRISHRGNALRAFRERLGEVLDKATT